MLALPIRMLAFSCAQVLEVRNVVGKYYAGHYMYEV